MRPSRLAAALGLAVHILAASGCGDTARSPSSPSAAPTVPTVPRAPTWIRVTWACDAAACEHDVEQIEQAASGIPGVTTIRSRADSSGAIVSIAFDTEDALGSASAVRDAVRATQPALSPAAMPTVSSSPRDVASRWIVLSGATMPALVDAARTVSTRLERVAGVRQATPCVPERRVVLEVDPQAAASFGVDPARIADLARPPVETMTLRSAVLDAAAVDPAVVLSRVGATASSGLLRRVDEDAPGCEVRAGVAPAVGISLRFTEGDTSGVESAVASSIEVLEAGGVSVRLTPIARGAARPIQLRAPDVELLRRLPPADGALVIDAPQASAVWFPDDPTRVAATLEQWRAAPGLHVAPARVDVGELRLSGPDDARLRAAALRLREHVVDAVDPDAGSSTSRLEVVPDRVAAARFGVSVSDIVRVVTLSTSGEVIGALADPARTPVVVRVGAATDARSLGEATVATVEGARVPLSALARIESRPAEPPLQRCDRRRCVVLELEAAAAAALELDALARAIELGPDESLGVGAAPPTR